MRKGRLLLVVVGLAVLVTILAACESRDAGSAGARQEDTGSEVAGIAQVGGVMFTFGVVSSSGLNLPSDVETGDELLFEMKSSPDGNPALRFLRNKSAERRAEASRAAPSREESRPPDGKTLTAYHFDLGGLDSEPYLVFRTTGSTPIDGTPCREIAKKYGLVKETTGLGTAYDTASIYGVIGFFQLQRRFDSRTQFYAVTAGRDLPDTNVTLVSYDGRWYLKSVYDDVRTRNQIDGLLNALKQGDDPALVNGWVIFSNPWQPPPTSAADASAGSGQSSMPESDVSTSRVHTPAAGSSERTAILDACRTYWKYSGKYVVKELDVQGERAIASLDEETGSRKNLICYLSREGGAWKVVRAYSGGADEIEGGFLSGD